MTISVSSRIVFATAVLECDFTTKSFACNFASFTVLFSHDGIAGFYVCFMIMPFLAIPSVRITAGGIVNIKDNAYIKPLQ